jgi:hypothetical protein
MLALDDTIVKKQVVSKRELSTFKVESLQQTKSEEPCSICLENFSVGDQVSILPCLHKFHENEILKWYETSGSSKCPVCGTAVKE